MSYKSGSLSLAEYNGLWKSDLKSPRPFYDQFQIQYEKLYELVSGFCKENKLLKNDRAGIVPLGNFYEDYTHYISFDEDDFFNEVSVAFLQETLKANPILSECRLLLNILPDEVNMPIIYTDCVRIGHSSYTHDDLSWVKKLRAMM